MIYGIGIDIIEKKRIANIIDRHSDKFIDRILSRAEINQCPENKARRLEYIAGRFAGKEAFAKALGTGIGTQVGWRDIEILNSTSGKPELIIRKIINNDNFYYHISISHTKDLAVAKVIIEHR